MHQIVIHMPLGGTRSPVTLLLTPNCLSPFFGSLGRPTRLKPFFYKQGIGDWERLLYPRRPHRVLLVFGINIKYVADFDELV